MAIFLNKLGRVAQNHCQKDSFGFFDFFALEDGAGVWKLSSSAWDTVILTWSTAI